VSVVGRADVKGIGVKKERHSAIRSSHNWSLGLLKAAVLLMVTLRARSITAFGGALRDLGADCSCWTGCPVK
jgi:hypothetical protein